MSKLDARVVAGGTVDEANTHIGLAIAHGADGPLAAVLTTIQQRLFDLGADITCPWDPEAAEDFCPRMAPRHIEWLEQQLLSFRGGLLFISHDRALVEKLVPAS